MESISIFDIFKVGIGPSSSHTLGPWKAALAFVPDLDLTKIDRITIQLYGSLSKTGLGHATDKAVILGLLGYDPTTMDTNLIDSVIEDVKSNNSILVRSKKVTFNYHRDIIFEPFEHGLHPNTLTFTAYAGDFVIQRRTYASVGGGFIEDETKDLQENVNSHLPFPVISGADLLSHTQAHNCAISELVKKNELALRTEAQINFKLDQILETKLSSIYKGCSESGVLPGGLNVSRRAKSICDKLLNEADYSSREEWLDLIIKAPKDFNSVNKWVSCFALAVNEENAAMGRIVTSPTNGAAGVIPAVFMYYKLFCDYQGIDSLRKFLFTAGEVGCIFKKGATISAAMGGCQAEIGVSAAMAAAGLTEVLGGSPEQCLVAAEIAMEHHLGLTCDPIKGLVQVPCIERNAMGAIKAITASNLALETNPQSTIVHIDTVIKTMWDVAQDMKSKYKETSEGGLAINLPVLNPNC